MSALQAVLARDQLTTTREQFYACAQQPGVQAVPVFRQLPADLETPVTLYLKLRHLGPSFLLESVEQAAQVGRYSILGCAPRRQIVVRGRQVTVIGDDAPTTLTLAPHEDPLDAIKAELARYNPVALPPDLIGEIPRFFGGAVGYLAYDLARFFERLPNVNPDPLGLPEVHMLLADTLVIFDHLKHRLLMCAVALLGPDGDADRAFDEATERLNELQAFIGRPLVPMPPAPGRAMGHPRPGTSRSQFEDAVRRAKAYIAAGDIFQVVLSQRAARPTPVDPFSIYRALRRLNPSPYMFFLDLGGDPPVRLIGSSPEMLVRLQGRTAETRPIAGTRPRGTTPEEDRRLEAELLADPKERAEHVMLVDLGRNDLGRVCTFGSVHVPDFFTVERYSHVMHIVSRVVGELQEGLNAFDLVRATFPAGTVSGAPKVRAMEIIEELENARRGPYAGAVGYFGFNGNMDTCITIRTIVMCDDVAYLQAGAGIVADSDPAREWEETCHKVRALEVAIEMAERGL